MFLKYYIINVKSTIFSAVIPESVILIRKFYKILMDVISE